MPDRTLYRIKWDVPIQPGIPEFSHPHLKKGDLVEIVSQTGDLVIVRRHPDFKSTRFNGKTRQTHINRLETLPDENHGNNS